MKLLPLLHLDVNRYGIYSLPPTKKEGGRMAIICKDVYYGNKLVLKKGTKGMVIPMGNFGIYMICESYNQWIREKEVNSYTDFIYEGSARLDRSYDFFHVYRKGGKESVGSWHTHISRIDFQYLETTQLQLFD